MLHLLRVTSPSGHYLGQTVLEVQPEEDVIAALHKTMPVTTREVIDEQGSASVLDLMLSDDLRERFTKYVGSWLPADHMEFNLLVDEIIETSSVDIMPSTVDYVEPGSARRFTHDEIGNRVPLH